MTGWSTGQATEPHDHRAASPDSETMVRRKKATAALRRGRERAAVQAYLKRFAALMRSGCPLPRSLDELPASVRPEVERAGGLVQWAASKRVVQHVLRGGK